MSRVGRLPVCLPDGVSCVLDRLSITIKGPKGVVSKNFAGDISIVVKDSKVSVQPLSKSSSARAMWGTARSIINNMVKGVSDGFVEELEINGVGYRAALQGEYLNLALGKSHNTKIAIPGAVQVSIPKPTQIILQSIDKEELGKFISIITREKPVEPYKGKGIRRKGQQVYIKEVKKS